MTRRKSTETVNEKEVTSAKKVTPVKEVTPEVAVDNEPAKENYKLFYDYELEQAKQYATEHQMFLAFITESDGANGDSYVAYTSMEDLEDGWVKTAIRNSHLTANADENKSEEQTDEVKSEEQDGTNSKDKIALSIAEVLNDTTEMSDTVKWAKILQLASSKVDESTITDLSLISDAEIMRRLRLLWSKRVAAKKANDLVLLASIDEDEKELQSHRKSSRSGRRGGSVVSADSDPTKLSQEDLNKLIRNVQSKKCSAKKVGDQVLIDTLQAEEDRLKALRTTAPKVATPSAMSTKIADTIAALELLPKSDVVDAQILMLKALL